VHTALMRELEIGEGEADRLMRQVAFDAIRERPLAYARIVLKDVGHIFLAEPDPFARHWQAHQDVIRSRNNPPPRQLRAFVGPPSPEQEQAYPITERLASLYQSTWLGPIVPLLALVGLLAAARTPAWRPALAPGLAAILLQAAGLAVIGLAERYRQPTEPLVHVMAFGGLLFLARAAYARLGQRRRVLDAERQGTSTGASSTRVSS